MVSHGLAAVRGVGGPAGECTRQPDFSFLYSLVSAKDVEKKVNKDTKKKPQTGRKARRLRCVDLMSRIYGVRTMVVVVGEVPGRPYPLVQSKLVPGFTGPCVSGDQRIFFESL